MTISHQSQAVGDFHSLYTVTIYGNVCQAIIAVAKKFDCTEMENLSHNRAKARAS